ncbi:hypothetical protein Dvina_12685 [Dactylosporangium vinaceum]|uniref:Uncharacterized protein n=1 Tax=Dactylosporangium vinaceum TaxID=53362 RepID=A0ABV5MFV0_9ACTN|nr:hypothetical protein [Dactylosporangium vinaceum]UAB98851.1 hypothetical protein Dvina_12685 [Dactylosporangium vinaceum]
MSDEPDLLVTLDAADLEAGEAGESVRRLWRELDALDVDGVEQLPVPPPEPAKGPGTALTLAVKIGAAGLRTVVAKIRDWVSRNDRTIELTVRGDTIRITKATPEQQQRLLDAWLARHERRGPG